MKFRSLVTQGFLSFKQEQVFNFDALEPGLYHLHGRNEVEPRLEGNGAGKSALLEAIYWCLYGVTSRGLRASALKNWHVKGTCFVALELEVPVGALQIYRQQGPNKLEVSVNGEKPRPVDQKELELLLTLPQEAFLYGVYHAQFEPRFLDLKPTKQMEVYSSVLALERWEEASAQASRRARDLEASLIARRQKHANLEGQAQHLVLEDYTADEEAWERDKRKIIAACEEQLKAERAVLKDLKKTIAKYREGSDKFRKLREQVQEAARKTAVAHAEFQRLEREFYALQRKDITNCPTCGAELKDRSHIKKEIKKAKAAMDEALRASDSCLAEHDRRLKLMAQHRDDEVKLLDAEKAYAAHEAIEITKMTEQEVAERGTNPFTKKRLASQARAGQLMKDLEDVEAAIAEEERLQKAAQYWTQGFKEIRLMLIQESLAQLQIESNECVYQLGLEDWSLEYDVERETKSGTVDRNFTVMVRAPDIKDLVPWAAWSGGESQRLRCAGTLGFSNLICSRMGLQPNLEIWDEPSTWMSKQGILDLLDVLSERAKRYGKIILLADHRVLDYGSFAGKILLVKDHNGSRIE